MAIKFNFLRAIPLSTEIHIDFEQVLNINGPGRKKSISAIKVPYEYFVDPR